MQCVSRIEKCRLRGQDLSDEFLSEEEVNHYMNLDEKEGFEKTGE